MPTTLSGDNTIFSQCTCATCTSQCLYLIIRSSRLFMGFNFNDLQGSTTLSTSVWYHVAFVYNYATLQQIIYLDGVQDSVRTNVQPYLGQNGSIIIGAQSSSSYYYGYIDNLALTTRAKSATEISNDATLLFYYSFDLPSPFYDNGPNRLNNTAISNYASVSSTSGRVNRGIDFTTTSSYFQMCCFYQLAWLASKPYTFAIWIYPTSINGGAIVHISYYYTNGGCCSFGGYGYDILALTYSGQIVTQVYYNSYFPGYIGPIIPINTWTHVACTYSSTNGVILLALLFNFAKKGHVELGEVLF
ncbi:unnamed protein product [Didymodactylos carnosus]|nr:unnamed protein product [Didymodactylos carnosus]CAF4410829.1 unnamed protein product [Didymodactylos carnosus]